MIIVWVLLPKSKNVIMKTWKKNQRIDEIIRVINQSKRAMVHGSIETKEAPQQTGTYETGGKNHLRIYSAEIFSFVRGLTMLYVRVLTV